MAANSVLAAFREDPPEDVANRLRLKHQGQLVSAQRMWVF